MPRKLYGRLTRISLFALALLAGGAVCRMVLPQNAAAEKMPDAFAAVDSAPLCTGSEFTIDYMVCTSEDAALTAKQTSLNIQIQQIQNVIDSMSSTELTEAQKASKYKFACLEYESGLWEMAANDFKILKDYKDSAKKYKSAWYQYGLELLDDEKYAEAVEVFESLGSYERSKSKLNAAKYGYVLECFVPEDQKVYDYLCDLKKAGYKDSKEIYEALYSWEVYGVINDSFKDETTNLACVSKWDDVYCHFKLSGGPLCGNVKLKGVATWPNGSTTTVKLDGTWRDGDAGYVYFYLKNPAKNKSGNMKIAICDATSGKKLAQFKVKLTD